MGSKKKKQRKKAVGHTPSNADLEMRWINAWNEIYEIIGSRREVKCQLPDGSAVTVEECQGWLQQSAYAGYLLRVEFGMVLGSPGIIVSRWRD